MKHSLVGRRKVITVKVDDREYAAIQHGAAKHGMGVSEYIRVISTMAGWTAEMRQKLHDWQEMIPIMVDERTEQDIDQRAKLLHDTISAIQKMADTAHRLQHMFSPTAAELDHMLEYLDSVEHESKSK